MVRLLCVVMFAPFVTALPAAADNDDEIAALTEKIESGKFAGLALAQAYMHSRPLQRPRRGSDTDFSFAPHPDR